MNFDDIDFNELYVKQKQNSTFKIKSQEAWDKWKSHQTTLINEKHLDMSNPDNRKWLSEQMDKFFNNEDYEKASGFKALD